MFEERAPHGTRHFGSLLLRIWNRDSAGMFMAYVSADREALLSVCSDPGKFYNADPFTFLMASLLVLVFGPGYFSVDRVLQAIRSSKLPAHDSETVGQRAIATAS